MAAELFAQLREFKWRDVSFPVSSFTVSLRQDLVQHKYPDTDGANVEATGRAPLVFHASIPFRNGIVRGPNEHWSTPLYPTAYREFLAACADRSTGDLQHPELGTLKCKLESCETAWKADRRDGCDVEVSWVETIDTDPSTTTALLEASSPVSQAIMAASDLDAHIAISVTIPRFGEVEPDFASSMRSLTAITDSATLLSSKVQGKLNSVAYRVGNIASSIDRAKNSLNWPAKQAVETIKSAIVDLKKQIDTVVGRDVNTYEVKADMTLAAVSASIPAPLGDIIKLNTTLMRSPIVPRGTLVRYYA